MTVAAEVVDRERIDRILNLIEHAWKLHPNWTLREVLDRAVPEGQFGSDKDLEHILRDYVRSAFARAKDET